MTVNQEDLAPLVIQDLEPLRIHSLPSAVARVRIAAACAPASRSGSAYDASCPFAMSGSTLCFSSSELSRIRAIVPSLFAAGISDEDPRTRATSSITMQVATESAPWPPYASGTWIALKPDALSATRAAQGIRDIRIKVYGADDDKARLEVMRAGGLEEALLHIGDQPESQMLHTLDRFASLVDHFA